VPAPSLASAKLKVRPGARWSACGSHRCGRTPATGPGQSQCPAPIAWRPGRARYSVWHSPSNQVPPPNPRRERRRPLPGRWKFWHTSKWCGPAPVLRQRLQVHRWPCRRYKLDSSCLSACANHFPCGRRPGLASTPSQLGRSGWRPGPRRKDTHTASRSPAPGPWSSPRYQGNGTDSSP